MERIGRGRVYAVKSQDDEDEEEGAEPGVLKGESFVFFQPGLLVSSLGRGFLVGSGVMGLLVVNNERLSEVLSRAFFS